ncbi:MAG TPA: ATPase domain-containing protein [bacterium]|nr:ATPase domain-containing protein [bacterium]
MYVCSTCGTTSTKWQGKCFSCGEWNTLVSAPEPKKSPSKRGDSTPSETKNLADIEAMTTDSGRLPTVSEELSRVLGGGLVPGSLTLLSGEPGIGKSTIALQIAGWGSHAGSSVLYATAEETLSQLANRAKRLGVDTGNIRAVNESDVDRVIETIRAE